MKKFQEFVAESKSWTDAHKEIQSHGYLNNNAGGGYSNSNGHHWHRYAKSFNVNGDDHLFSITANYKKSPHEFTASHHVSRGYWGDRWDNPRDHVSVASKTFNSHEDALAFVNDLVSNRPKNK